MTNKALREDNAQCGEHHRSCQDDVQREARHHTKESLSLTSFWDAVDPLPARSEVRAT